MISYEVSIGILYWVLLMITHSLSLVKIVLQQQNLSNMIGLPLLFMLFLISCLAETSRVPFDLAEAETELIAGFHVELAGIGFTLFFLAEYANIVAVCLLTTTLFVGGWCILVVIHIIDQDSNHSLTKNSVVDELTSGDFTEHPLFGNLELRLSVKQIDEQMKPELTGLEHFHDEMKPRMRPFLPKTVKD